MKKHSALIASLILLLALLVAPASYAVDYNVDILLAEYQGYELTEDDYYVYYEIVEYLCADWETPWDELMDALSYEYDITPDELYAFILYAADYDSDHVWIPVNGGKRFHVDDTCSKMVEPRPCTKDLAYDFGFSPCGRCKPGE